MRARFIEKIQPLTQPPLMAGGRVWPWQCSTAIAPPHSKPFLKSPFELTREGEDGAALLCLLRGNWRGVKGGSSAIKTCQELKSGCSGGTFLRGRRGGIWPDSLCFAFFLTLPQKDLRRSVRITIPPPHTLLGTHSQGSCARALPCVPVCGAQSASWLLPPEISKISAECVQKVGRVLGKAPLQFCSASQGTRKIRRIVQQPSPPQLFSPWSDQFSLYFVPL